VSIFLTPKEGQKMKKLLLSKLIVLTLFLVSGQRLLAEQNLQTTGTIRGGVYLDADGDGVCVDTGADEPIPGINIVFNQNEQNIILYSGDNGTYGLPVAGQGVWWVTVQPDSAQWLVTSARVQQVSVSEEDGLVQLGVDFCLQPKIGIAIAAETTQRLPEEDVIAVTRERVAASAPEPMTESQILSATSEELLTNPPEPTPDPQIDEYADADVDLVPEANWLAYLNLFREMGNLPRLQGEESLSEGSQLHSQYMVLYDEPVAHKEDPIKDLYTIPGDNAAQNSNIFATTQMEADYKWGVNFWMSAPFHQVPLIDPELTTVGYGNFNKDVGTFNMAAVLDVLTSEENPDPAVEYPVYFPGQDSATWIVRHSLYEWPDPLESCPGYIRPVGPSLVLQLGDGSKTPRVTSHRVMQGDIVLESCMFHETSYVNTDPYAQSVGRIILDERDAVVILPRLPLEMDQTYTVEVWADGRLYTWSFSTGPVPAD
jgi:uncharacterized protein YkwD